MYSAGSGGLVMDALARQTSMQSVRRKPESLAKLKKSARKLFVERGYHLTRPQDITREAGLGHGTFYLHFEDKRACYLAFVEEARTELYGYIRSRVGQGGSLEETVARTLNAIYDYSDANPGVFGAAMADEAIIDAGGAQTSPLLQRWGRDWAESIRDGARQQSVADDYDPDIVGHAIVGAIHHCRLEGDRSGRERVQVVENLTRFLVRALKP
jgi:AcrR family transcriptional regulator